MNEVFSNEFLQVLARKRFDIQDLHKAIRMAVIIQDIHQNSPTNSFKFHEWLKEFCPEAEECLKSGAKSEIEKYVEQHPQSTIGRPATSWLEGIDVTGLIKTISRDWHLEATDIEKLMAEPLFAISRKTLQNYFQHLADENALGVLNYELSSRQYTLVKNPIEQITKKLNKPSLLADSTALKSVSEDEWKIFSEGLDMLSFLDPRFAPIFENLPDYQPETPRVLLHVDYILPEEVQDRVDDLQEKLQDIWAENPVPPIRFKYSSAKLQNKTADCIVYPICIYYVQRAKYLCAYGRAPNGKVDYYNYRLDRIDSKQIEQLEWDNPDIPQRIYAKYKNQQLPTAETIQSEFQSAWGFDFYKPAHAAILRFNRAFHDCYIQQTFRHETFERIDYQQAGQLIRQNAASDKQAALLAILAQRASNDAYYAVQYRQDDNNIIMRLRSWSPNVEVMAPHDLRQRMADDIQASGQLYATPH